MMLAKTILIRLFIKQTKQCRFYSNSCCNNSSSSNQEVRVRFAPSPTGFLHLGGLRTALYNYLFAKSRKGKFILRIEDTDQTRLVEGATSQLQKDLSWAGIQIDEGPNISGHSHFGPYIQSERVKLYQEQTKVLLENGSAYHCFCTDKRLNLLRKEALRLRQVPKYDNKCRDLAPDEVTKRLERGDKHCIRFKLLPDCETFDDLIYGNIAYDVALNEGDPVILKGDGFPTYHFANVVDDHFMRITHVLRGVEWQISTTKHILMYRAFGWQPPRFGHLPLLMNPDGTKLSKRQGDIQIAHYRDNGIFPQALINFVISCGGGFNFEQNIKMKCYSMDELMEQFDIDRVNAHSTRLMPEKLLDFNRLELINQLNNANTCNVLIKDVQKLLQSTYPEKIKNGELQIDNDYVKSIIKWSSNRIYKLSDLLSKDLLFLWITPVVNSSINQEQLEIIEKLNENFVQDTNIMFQTPDLKKYLKDFAENHNIAFNKLMKLLRSVLSGLKEGPGVAEMIEILGKENTIHRFEVFLRKNNNNVNVNMNKIFVK